MGGNCTKFATQDKAGGSCEAVYLFTLYGKNEQSDLSPDEKKVFRQALERLHKKYST